MLHIAYVLATILHHLFPQEWIQHIGNANQVSTWTQNFAFIAI